MNQSVSRRKFVQQTGAGLCVASAASLEAADPKEPIIDIHQHTHYHGRSDQQMIAHQRAMGIAKTILLPAGRPLVRKSTRGGRSNGLAAKVSGNESAQRIVKQLPGEFYLGANEVTDMKEARKEIEAYLKKGAVIIGEQKFDVECDSAESQELYRLAADYGVPILLHFQYRTYNRHFERFWKMLEKHPQTNFIGHAQTWWANIDKNYDPKSGNYPTGPVTAGGLTDKYLQNYPNMFADMSAGSGLNSLLRDEEHTIGFFDRNQDKVLYGSDCADTLGRGPGCQGSRTIAAIRRLARNPAIRKKILWENSRKLFRLK
jgi:predicted TIM-barrel fold metal-dependent hydrolase